MITGIIDTTAWKLKGNTGTVAGTNFIGTTDNVDWVVKTNNTERMRVQAGGNVGIGESAPASLFSIGSGSLFRVDALGDLTRVNNVPYSWPSSQGAAGTVLTNDGAGTLSWSLVSAGTVTSIATQDGITGGTITNTGTIGLTGQALALHNQASDGFFYKSGSTIGARAFTTSGNGISIANGDGALGNPTISLSIGTGATDVAAGNHTHAQLHNQLHAITSTSDHSAGNWKVFYSDGSGAITELGLGASGEVLKSNGTAAAPSWQTDNAGSGTVTGSGVATRVAFWSSTSALSSNANLYWDNTNGRLGIGTTTPAYSLDSTGDIYANGGWMRVSGSNGIYFETHGGGWYMSDATWIRSFGSKSIYHNAGIMRTDGTFQVGSSGGTLNVPNAGDFAYKSDVIFGDYSTGNVGIGTTSPTYKLHVIGRLKTTGINETSDKRYKKDIKGLESSLEKISQLNGVSYLWRTDEFPEQNFPTDRQIGVIAQDIEKIIPEVVDTDSEGYKSVEYSHLVPILIEAVKELKLQNDLLKTEVSSLQNTVELQKQQINSISESTGINIKAEKASK